ncbi:Membrane-associated protein containing RNA-binding TRAM domain and ribonuclease PIN-domain, YacL B.subtilis ortholog [hydrothermal vent metagenome]|uniref:Membrane-associated protein containing RNA-binding TRAM domain and ribonuclease PIN-domain, YacL B.subtilis ortholog n=1 Tax=hydrothermal vent metagenome TaxID=652676 RepID=A0A3B1DW59_9ZZZZ
MTLSFLRVFFIIGSGLVGHYVGSLLQDPNLGWMIGCLVGLVIIFLEQRVHHVSLRGLSSMVFGLILGVVMAKLMSDIISLIPLGEFFHSVSRVVLTLIFSYLGAVLALRGKDEFNVIIPYVRFKRQDIKEGIILLDTSVIIDGRVRDIYKINFLNGRLVVPRFVLEELQQLADSSNDNKRQKGRRGMELLREMQKDTQVDIRIHEDDLIEEEEVDARLIHLSKMMDARLCTTDFNLGRIAGIQGIEVLNIHELSNMLKPVTSSGEQLQIKLVKKGRESGQAVGYLEDGTMVVVAEAESEVGKDVNVTVTSVLQTQAGKMVFGKL